MRIFVTGVTGQLGRVLAKTLSKRHEVVGLARPNSQTQQVVANLSKLVLGDLLYPEGFIDEVAVCDCIIFNAAVYRDSGVNTDTYFRVNVGSLARVFELLRKHGNVRTKKAILVSTNAVHDLTKDKPVTETSSYGPADYYQYSKLLAEFEFLKWVEILGFQGNIVRPAMIWGDGDERLKKIFLLAKKKLIPVIGNHNPWCHFITFSDVAWCIERLIENNDLSKEAFLVAGRRAVRLRSLLGIISFMLGKKPVFFNIPLGLLYFLTDYVEPIFRLFGKNPPLFRRRLAFFTKNRIFDCSKFEKFFGKPYSEDLLVEIHNNLLDYQMIPPSHEIFEYTSRFEGGVNKNARIYLKYDTWTWAEEKNEVLLQISPEVKPVKFNFEKSEA